MKLLKDIYAGLLMLSTLRVFDPGKEFRGKRIAIVGAADSAFDEKNGKFIDRHDIVIRINRAPYSWNREKSEYIGSKFTFLYHSFYENNYSGGGPIDWDYFDRLDIDKVINPINSRKGLRTHLSYYKRNHSARTTYILSRPYYKELQKDLGEYVPTVGFSALMTVLRTDFKELYITGFTFFKTSYADGYRDHLLRKEDNQQHIAKQGLHNPEHEFEVFKKEIQLVQAKKQVAFDKRLSTLLESRSWCDLTC